jgi:aspartyl-tRNA(Asn)/glutamyl-tRNA(Gln) amidotransferase subunit B
VEIVSEPDIRSAEQARLYASELRGILVATGASDGRMEEGSMRIDANVSVRRMGTSELGTRCEVKNLNSLRSLGRAIDHEIERQTAIVSAGGSVVQQTRHWDEQKGLTVALRSKEEAFDYRYFSEPDLVPLDPDPSWLQEVASSIGPMPAERRAAVKDALGGEATPAQSDQILTVVDLDLDPLVLSAVAAGIDPGLALRRTANEAAAEADLARTMDRGSYTAMLRMEQQGELTATQSKVVLAEMLESGGDPVAIASAKGFEALAAGSLGGLVAEVVGAHPEEWDRYRAGDEKVSGFFIREVMQASDGKASGKEVKSELDRLRSQPL